MTLVQFIFFYNAAVITLCSYLVVTRRNPVHSVLFMLLMFFHIAGLYLTLNSEFIAALQVIVYAGAILVLFLFVIFLLNLRDESLEAKSITNWPTAAVISLSLFAVVAGITSGFKPGATGQWSIEKINEVTHIKAIGMVLYTEYIFPFEVASLVLLVAMIGAITLAKKHVD